MLHTLMVYLHLIALVSGLPCGRPEIPAHGSISPFKESYSAGDNVTLTCFAGFRLGAGTEIRECRNGSWSGKAALCLRADACASGGLIVSPDECVHLHSNKLTWMGARDFCQTGGKRLLNIDNSAKLSAALSLKPAEALPMWVAAQSSKQWIWEDGTRIEEFFWGIGEPSNNPGTQENKLMLRTTIDYAWTDMVDEAYSYNTVNKFICEYNRSCAGDADDATLDVNGTCFVLTAKISHTQYDGDCIRINKGTSSEGHDTNHWVGDGHTDPNAWKTFCSERGATWTQSSDACKSQGGQLAIMGSSALNSAITNYIRELSGRRPLYGGNYWLGGSVDKTAGPVWSWESVGSNVQKTWLPASNLSDYQCGAITSSGVVSFPCDHQYPFLCSSPMLRIENETRCGVPPQPLNTISYDSSQLFSVGETTTFTCAGNYRAVNGTVSCTCLSTGLWSETCPRAITCTVNPSTAESIYTTPDSTNTTPGPTNTTPDPTNTTPDPINTTPGPTNTTPDSTNTTHNPTNSTPDPTNTTHDPTNTTHDPTNTTHDSKNTTHDPTDSTPDSTNTTPGPTNTTPGPTNTTHDPTLTTPNLTNTSDPTDCILHPCKPVTSLTTATSAVPSTAPAQHDSTTSALLAAPSTDALYEKWPENGNSSFISTATEIGSAAKQSNLSSSISSQTWIATGVSIAFGLCILFGVICAVLICRKEKNTFPSFMARRVQHQTQYVTSENPLFQMTDLYSVPENTVITTYKGDKPFRRYSDSEIQQPDDWLPPYPQPNNWLPPYPSEDTMYEQPYSISDSPDTLYLVQDDCPEGMAPVTHLWELPSFITKRGVTINPLYGAST